jgi:hypothetical protein
LGEDTQHAIETLPVMAIQRPAMRIAPHEMSS